ncbi:MAG TPA: hypothetical protein PKA63_00965 [Oligoflexia bacterium]|nr:hypothetical protein [Oligoflexia bacterium]HMP47219.1 hypothetical protein [Oligoflexia bacterium]
MKKILLLDDDKYLLSSLSTLLSSWGYNPLCFTNVEDAESYIRGGEENKVDFAIVDLFLLGARGDALSNGFIRNEILPKGIPYLRLTSAPDLVPKDLIGFAILDKREIELDFTPLKFILEEVLSV